MQITDKLPQPKFQIGQRVYVKANYTMATITDKIYVVIQITMSCLSVTRYPFEKDEPYDYMLIQEDWIGKPRGHHYMLYNCRESFMEGLE